nr:sulfite exporter TauE/SafE family protein [Sphingopyxis indica]
MLVLVSSTDWLVPALGLLGAGLAAGFAGGVFGIGGGFVVVPALLLMLPLLGGDSAQYAHVAIGTSAATIIITSLRSVTSHNKRGSVDFQILKTWAPWIVLGDGLGVILASHVDGHVLTMVFATGVLLMSLNFLLPRLGDKILADEMPTGVLRIGIAGGLGTFSSLLGIGGGTIAIMVMTLCGRSIHRAVGTAAGIGTLIAIPSAIGFAIIGLKEHGLPWGSLGFVNLPATAAITSMSILTAPLGVAAAHALEPRMLKRVFGIYLIIIAIVMFHNAMKP